MKSVTREMLNWGLEFRFVAVSTTVSASSEANSLAASGASETTPAHLPTTSLLLLMTSFPCKLRHRLHRTQPPALLHCLCGLVNSLFAHVHHVFSGIRSDLALFLAVFAASFPIKSVPLLTSFVPFQLLPSLVYYFLGSLLCRFHAYSTSVNEVSARVGRYLREMGYRPLRTMLRNTENF